MRVAIKNIEGVNSVDVSLSKGTATVTFVPGNHVRYEQLLAAIAKNGFVVKGTKLVAAGTIENSGSGEALRVSGSNDVFRLVASTGSDAAAVVRGGRVEVEGEIPEIGNGQKADTLRFEAVRGSQ